MNISDILLLKFPQINLTSQVVIQDDGHGAYISKWDNSLGSQPTQADLDQWALELAPIKATQDARQSRRENYPAIGDQLDMLYKAMDSGILPIVPEFYNSIKAVKTRFPL